MPGEWGAWSKCEGECGEGKGTRLRFRPVIKPERCGGKPCIVAEGQTCTRPDCPMAITENGTLTLPMLRLIKKYKDTKIFEKHLNLGMLVFIG